MHIEILCVLVNVCVCVLGSHMFSACKSRGCTVLEGG